MFRSPWLLTVLIPASLAGQVDLSARWGIAASGGHAIGTAEDRPTLHPGISPNIAISIGLQRGAGRAQATLRRTASNLVLLGREAGIITPGALESWIASFDFGRRILGESGGAALTLLATVERIVWRFPQFQDESRTRWGAGLALEGTLPLATRWSGILRSEFGFAGSLFTTEELPEGFELTRARRAVLSLGLRLHLGARRLIRP